MPLGRGNEGSSVNNASVLTIVETLEKSAVRLVGSSIGSEIVYVAVFGYFVSISGCSFSLI